MILRIVLVYQGIKIKIMQRCRAGLLGKGSQRSQRGRHRDPDGVHAHPRGFRWNDAGDFFLLSSLTPLQSVKWVSRHTFRLNLIPHRFVL